MVKDERNKETAARTNNAIPRRQLRLLIVEDNPADADLLVALLKLHGYVLLYQVVDSPESFRAQIEQENYDVVLADYNLRAWTAMDALQIVKQSAKDIPFLVVTGTLGDEAAVECIKRGADDYILKDRLHRLPMALERALHERALRQEAARLHELIQCAKKEWEVTFDAVPDPVLLMDQDGRIRRANWAAAALVGAKPAELVGRFYYEVLHGRNEPLPNCPHYRLLESGLPQRCDLEEPRLGKWFDVTVTPLREGGGSVVKSVHVMRDITERKRAEERLRQQTTYLNALIENSPLGIIAQDQAGRVQVCNPAFQRLFLYGPDEMVGWSLEELIAIPELVSEAKEVTRRVLAGETVHLTTRRRRKDGTLVDVELYGVPLVVCSEVIGAYGLYEDITQRKHLERELSQAQKMEAIGRLAGGIAHDFNNLLEVIIGYSELLAENLGPRHPQREKVEGIRMAGEHAALLTRQLLAFGRKQVLEPKIVGLNALVAEVARLLTRLIGENIQLVVVPGQEVGRVKADRAQLEQVILNLALNARDAMPQGGRVTIETANVELDETNSRRHVDLRPGSYVMLAVSDTGCGIEPEQQSHIFEPFFTTKGPGGGTGLGLATVYGIVKQSQGHIWLYSEPGRGSTFKIYLPRVAAAVEAGRPATGSPPSVVGSETILLVEDEEAVREVARESLKLYGYRVLETGNAEDAVELAQHHEGQIHLLLTDVVMPATSGRALAERLGALRPDMKVLYMSGYADEAIIHHGLLEPGTAFLQKPFRPVDLARKVQEVLAKETPAARPLG